MVTETDKSANKQYIAYIEKLRIRTVIIKRQNTNHFNFDKINDYNDEDNIHQYFVCLKSKITQQPISKVSDIKNPYVLYYIYSNIYSPIQKQLKKIITTS